MPVARGLIAALALAFAFVLAGAGAAAAHTPLDGDIVLGARVPTTGRPGKVVVAWLTKGEDEARRAGKLSGRKLVDLVTRFAVLDVARVEPGARVPFRIAAPGGVEVVPVAWLDAHGAFWPTFMGSGPAGNGFGAGQPVMVGARARALVEIDDVVQERSPRREECSSERFELVVLSAPEVRGAVGNAEERRLCVSLPPGYDDDDERRYPVIYLLPGLFGDDMARLRRREEVIAWADERGGAILVGVDGRAATGASYFVDGPMNGAWRSFLVERVVRFVDSRYRTVAHARGRALLGSSTGGFNALALALAEPDVFGAAAGDSPDPLDFEAWLIPDGRADPRWLAWLRFDAAVGGPSQGLSWASDFSPSDDGESVAWPLDLATGEPVPDVLARWQARSPVGLLEEHAAIAREKLDGRLFISCARDDEFSLAPPARRFAERLRALGIGHAHLETRGDHTGGRAARLRAATHFLLDVLARETPR